MHRLVRAFGRDAGIEPAARLANVLDLNRRGKSSVTISCRHVRRWLSSLADSTARQSNRHVECASRESSPDEMKKGRFECPHQTWDKSKTNQIAGAKTRRWANPIQCCFLPRTARFSGAAGKVNHLKTASSRPPLQPMVTRFYVHVFLAAMHLHLGQICQYVITNLSGQTISVLTGAVCSAIVVSHSLVHFGLSQRATGGP